MIVENARGARPRRKANKEESKMLSINIQDVLNVLSSVKNHLIVLGVALVVSLVALVAFKALPVAK